MWLLLACTIVEPAPDVAYGGGSIWADLTLSDEFDEGPIGRFEVEGTDDPGGFDFEACTEGAALRLGNDALHEEVVACFWPDEMEGFDLKEVRRWCGIDDYERMQIRFSFDEDGDRIYSNEPVMAVEATPAGGLEAWSQAALQITASDTHSMEVEIARIDWTIIAAEEEGCDKHQGILGTGTARIGWAFDPDVRAVLD